MDKLPKVIEERIIVAIDRFIKPLVYRSEVPLEITAAAVGGEPISYDAALELDYQPFKEGDAWGARWDTTWFRFRGVVPADWEGGPVVAAINLSFEEGEGFGREGIVYLEGQPVIAVNRNRQAVPLLEDARGGEEIDFYVEAAANPVAQMFWGDNDLLMPDFGGKPLFKLRHARLSTYDPEAFQLQMDFEACSQAMFELPENQPRRGQLRRALNQACHELDLGNPECIPAARAALKDVMSRSNGDTIHQITAVGHAHIDTAWCWPLRETIRKCARTFSTALRYMEKYPDYKFVCSQPVQYLWMKEHYPSIYEDIKAAVKRGQWELVGSMWVEADCNITSGESLIRQVLHGKHFFQQEFGVETKDLWLPDVFGYAAALPQILRKSNIDCFLTQKISWSDTNKFPHHTFHWEGLDGSQIFTHFPPVDTYNCGLDAKELMHSMQNFQDNDRANRALIPYGFGDGGGGPTVEQIEKARRWEDFEGMPQVELGTVVDFFAKAKKDAIDPPVWRGELYLELHRGTLTSQAYTKMMNRRCELLLRDAEMLQVIAESLGSGDLINKDPAEEIPVYDVPGHIASKDGHITDMALDRAWKLLLLNQFHDIIPGSSIHWVYEDCKVDYPNVEKIALAVRAAGMEFLASKVNTSDFTDPVIAFNSLSQNRSEVIELDSGDLVYAETPQCGYTVLEAKDASTPDWVSEVCAEELNDGSVVIDNGLIRIHIDDQGHIVSFVDEDADREVITKGKKGNLFQIHKDYPNRWNAWDVDVFYRDECTDLDSGGSIKLVKASPLRAVVEVTRAFGKSSYTQEIVVSAGTKRVDFHTDIDWQERDRLLKVAFPVEVSCLRATYEIQYGHVERNTHSNTSWDMAKFEVPAHKWADLSEGDYGVALINNCKYAYDIDANIMRLTLLKAANAPDPVADLGRHQFSYALFPHEGGVQDGNVIEEAYAFNVPLVLHKTSAHKGELNAKEEFFGVDRPGVFIEAVKKAEAGDSAIVRVYEGNNTRGLVQLSSALGAQEINEVNLMEQPLDQSSVVQGGEIEFKIRPFEIRTFALKLLS